MGEDTSWPCTAITAPDPSVISSRVEYNDLTLLSQHHLGACYASGSGCVRKPSRTGKGQLMRELALSCS